MYHLDVVEALKEAITGLAIVVRVDLVLLALIVGWVRLITNAAVPSEMVLVVYMLPASVLTVEVWCTNFKLALSDCLRMSTYTCRIGRIHI